ncbi:unnamed protein product [Owenia fusiformis]|uniref:Uncharacterized protein n=1 Tax=Owenia fusiformis TaxID=6347 RepID=A0A8J1TVV4_OWEFU|nr:unnamed protein product [Owenia fusiformis]
MRLPSYDFTQLTNENQDIPEESHSNYRKFYLILSQPYLKADSAPESLDAVNKRLPGHKGEHERHNSRPGTIWPTAEEDQDVYGKGISQDQSLRYECQATTFNVPCLTHVDCAACPYRNGCNLRMQRCTIAFRLFRFGHSRRQSVKVANESSPFILIPCRLTSGLMHQCRYRTSDM